MHNLTQAIQLSIKGLLLVTAISSDIPHCMDDTV